MKKLISFVLALSMLLCTAMALSSCGEETSPERMVVSALEKTNALDDYAGKMKIMMSLEMSGQTIAIDMITDMKMENANSDDIKAQMDIEMWMLGSKITMTSYRDKEWVYTVDPDGSYKTKILEEEENQMDTILKELPSELFEGIEIVNEEDGSRSVTVAIPDETFNEIYSDLLETVKESFAAQDATVTISNAVVKINVKGDLVASYDISFDMETSVAGTTGTVEVTATVEFTQYEGVQVTFPAGYESFPEM